MSFSPITLNPFAYASRCNQESANKAARFPPTVESDDSSPLSELHLEGFATAAKIQTLMKIKQNAAIKNVFYTAAAYSLQLTLIGIPLGAYMIVKNPFEQRLDELNREIWILENAPKAMHDVEWKRQFLEVLEKIDLLTKSLAPSSEMLEWQYPEDRPCAIKEDIHACYRQLDCLKRRSSDSIK